MRKNCSLLLLFLLGVGFWLGSLPLNAETSNGNIYSNSEKKSAVSKKSGKENEQKIIFQWHRRNLERHFNKHRAEFPEYKNFREYGEAAIKFFSDPPKGTLFKRRANGDRLFYYEKSNIFGAATKNGFIKTFFRPNRGKRYWLRQ